PFAQPLEGTGVEVGSAAIGHGAHHRGGDRRCEQGVAGGDRADRCAQIDGGDVLEQVAGGPGSDRRIDVLVLVEGVSTRTLTPSRAGSATIARVASMPSMTGMRMSMSTTSGRSWRTWDR